MNSPPHQLREELPSSSNLTVPLLEAYTAVEIGKDEDIEQATSSTSLRTWQSHEDDINDGYEENKQRLEFTKETEFIKAKRYAKFMLFFIGLQISSFFILSGFLFFLFSCYGTFVLISHELQGYGITKIPNDETVEISNTTLIVDPILFILNYTTPSVTVTGQQINDANDSILTDLSYEALQMLDILLQIILPFLAIFILSIQIEYLRDHLKKMKHNTIKYFGTATTISNSSGVVEYYYEEVRFSGITYCYLGCIIGFWLAVGTLSYVLPLFCQRTVSSLWNKYSQLLLYLDLVELIIFNLVLFTYLKIEDDDDDDQEDLKETDAAYFQLD